MVIRFSVISMHAVAAGRFDLYYEGKDGTFGPKPWDMAGTSFFCCSNNKTNIQKKIVSVFLNPTAGRLIVREANGIITCSVDM